MAFLHRPSQQSLRQKHAPSVSSTPSRPQNHIFKRVSNIFVVRSRSRTTSQPSPPPPTPPKEHIPPPVLTYAFPTLARTPSTVSVASSDIRCPSDLGRSVSIHSLPPSPATPWFPALPAPPAHLRQRAHSTPILLSAFPTPPEYTRTPTPRLPPEVLALVLVHLPRPLVARLASLARQLAAAAHTVLYTVLDLRTIPNACVPLLLRTLALAPAIAAHVHALTLTPLAAAHPLAPRALHNTPHLTALTLPAVVPAVLRSHTAFGLTRLTLLSRTLTPAALAALLAWLDGQTNVTSLALPRLAALPPEPAPPEYPTALARVFPLLALPPSPRTPSTNSPTLLPALTTLDGPPALILLLAPTRPRLRAITLRVRTTLYTGLRPAAIARVLHAVSVLRVVCARHIDRRSVEKLLTTIGGADNALGIQTLHVHVAWPPDETSTLYRALHTVLPRFHALRILVLSLHPPPAEFHDDTRRRGGEHNRGLVRVDGERARTGWDGGSREDYGGYWKAAQNQFVQDGWSGDDDDDTEGMAGAVCSSCGACGACMCDGAFWGGAGDADGAEWDADGAEWDLDPALDGSGGTGALTHAERGHAAAWARVCAGLRRVVFVSGGVWVRGPL